VKTRLPTQLNLQDAPFVSLSATNGASILIRSDRSVAPGIAFFEKTVSEVTELAEPKALLEKAFPASL